MVSSQAQRICSTTVQRIALKRLADPTPMIAAEMLWVVETGIPRCVAIKITTAELVSAAKPLIGCSLTILWPRVLMTRQPPTAVPDAMVSAHNTLIQIGISTCWPGSGIVARKNPRHAGRCSNCPVCVAPSRASAMMPMVFCASFVPCIKPIEPALTICACLKKRLTRDGCALRNSPNSSAIKQKLSRKPNTGEVIMGAMTFHNRPLPRYQWTLLGNDQTITRQLLCEAASAAPQRPPIRAWLEMEGRPNHQEIGRAHV